MFAISYFTISFHYISLEVFEKYSLKNNIRTIFSSKVTYPQRIGFLEPSHGHQKSRFGLSALFHLMLCWICLVLPKGTSPLIVWWVEGGAYFQLAYLF